MFRGLDWWLTASYFLLSTISLVIIASVAPARLAAQAVWLLIGLGIYLYLSKQDSAVYIALSRVSYPLAIILLLLTFLLGQDVRGSMRWIEIGSFHLQTSEISKPLLILAFSRIISHHNLSKVKNLFIIALYLALPIFLILRQPDLGTTLVVIAIVIAQLFIAEAPLWLFGLGASVLALITKYSEYLLHDYQLRRLESFVDPTTDPLGAGYNVIQSIIAVGSGGLFGKGLGNGTQSHLRFLPERHTDFVYASLVEELGVIGGLVIIITIAVILHRISIIMLRCQTDQSKVILAGVFGYIFFQSIVNIGMNLGIAPVTGVTLPLVSYGGSSVLAVAISLGIAGSISRSRLHLNDLIEIK